MLYTIVLEKCFEFQTSKASVIVSYYDFRNSKLSKHCSQSSTTAADVADLVWKAFIHFECVSIRTRTIFPSKRLA